MARDFSRESIYLELYAGDILSVHPGSQPYFAVMTDLILEAI